MNTMKSTVLVVCVALYANLFLAPRSDAAEPLKIRVGWVVTPSELQPILFAKEGIAKHQGKSYVLDAIRYQGSPLMITALATGDLDIGALGYSSLSVALQNANMTDLRIIADEFQDGIGDHYSNEFIVRDDGGINKIQDLKGKVLATNSIGSLVDLPLRLMLRKNGLEDKRDFTVIEAPFPTMKAMLQSKKADLITSVLPFSLDPTLRNGAKTLFTQKEAMGPSQFSVWVAKTGFLAKNRAAMVDFMEDTMRAVRWYLDPRNHDEVVQIVAKYTKTPPERYSGWVFTKKDYYRSPDLLPDLVALQRNVDVQIQLGFLKAGLDISKFVDLSIVQEAASRLR